MYTELIFGASFKEDTPKELIDTLRWMAGDLDQQPEVCLWNNMRNPLSGGSFYFAVDTHVTKMWFAGDSWRLSSRANIKNYGNEIEEFLNMVKPYIEYGSGERDFYAIVTYEASDEPTIYYLDKPSR